MCEGEEESIYQKIMILFDLILTTCMISYAEESHPGIRFGCERVIRFLAELAAAKALQSFYCAQSRQFLLLFHPSSTRPVTPHLFHSICLCPKKIEDYQHI
jgi:hypothetical protein